MDARKGHLAGQAIDVMNLQDGRKDHAYFCFVFEYNIQQQKNSDRIEESGVKGPGAVRTALSSGRKRGRPPNRLPRTVRSGGKEISISMRRARSRSPSHRSDSTTNHTEKRPWLEPTKVTEQKFLRAKVSICDLTCTIQQTEHAT